MYRTAVTVIQRSEPGTGLCLTADDDDDEDRSTCSDDPGVHAYFGVLRENTDEPVLLAGGLLQTWTHTHTHRDTHTNTPHTHTHTQPLKTGLWWSRVLWETLLKQYRVTHSTEQSAAEQM